MDTSTSGKTMSEFVLERACAEAEQVLAEERTLHLSPAKWLEFTQALNARSRPETAA